MQLNPNLPLVMSDVHIYDIEACHYTILKNKGFDLSQVDPEDKLGRNIAIGQMMRDNPRITSLLRTTTESVINDYINVNNILPEEIIIRQYDGLILTRQLKVTNVGHIPLERRKTYASFISSIKRNSYIAQDDERNLSVKGVAHQYDEMNEIYKKLCRTVQIDAVSRFDHLQKIKDEFFESEDPELFGIPLKNGKFNIFLKGYGELEVSQSTLKIMDTDDVDRERYFHFYIEPFTKSIVIESIGGK
jgi:hypothetical protein